MPRIPQDTSDQKGYADFTKKLWGNLDGFYGMWIERWRMVLDYIRSQHWRTLQSLSPETIPEWEEFPNINFVGAIYQDYMRQWMQSKVRFSAMPDSPNSKEISAAGLADHILRYTWDKIVMPVKTDLGAWILTTGNGTLRAYWDTNTGNLIPLAIPDPRDPTGQTLIPINPDTGKPDPSMSEPIMVDAGEIGLESISPQLTRWPFEKAHGAMVGFLLSYDDVCAKYGDKVAENIKYQKTHTAVSADLLSLNAPGVSDVSLEERALIVEHYLPRSFKNPQGLWWTTAISDRKLVTPVYPLPSAGSIKTAEMPVIPFRWVPMPGHPTLGMSPLFDVRAANKIYEKSLKRTMEWQNKVVPKRLIPAGGGLKRGDFTAEPAQEVTFNPGAEPKYDVMPQPPNTFAETRQEAEQAIQMIALYKFKQPQQPVPGQPRQGMRQPQNMVNQDDEVALAIMNSADSWTKLAYVILGYMAKFYTEQRTISVVGPDNSYQWKAFTGADLSNFRATLRIDEQSLYTWNRQQMQDTVVALLSSQAGASLFAGPDGQPDKDKVEAALEAVGLNEGFSTIDPDVTEARNEINAFENIQDPPPPQPGQQPQQADPGPQAQQWQNHAAHMDEKLKIVKSMAFKGWSQSAQQAMMKNISDHEQMEAEQQQQQQQQMVGQEQALRQVRAETEAAGVTRATLGELLVKAMVDAMTGEHGRKERELDIEQQKVDKPTVTK